LSVPTEEEIPPDAGLVSTAGFKCESGHKGRGTQGCVL